MIEEVKQYLLSKGFITIDDNTFELVQLQTQQMIINGQVMNQDLKSVLKFVYIGEGSIDNDTIWGFSIYKDGNHIVDEWFGDIEQFKMIF